MISVNNVLISVSDKSEVVDFAKGLKKMKVNILATGGTARRLEEEGIQVKKISNYTGYAELLGGRVKTLHPKIFAGILAKRDKANHRDELKNQDILPIDLVVVNLYPFESQVTKDTPMDQAMELMDIGGETLIRSAAKNHPHVGVIVDPNDYQDVLTELEENGGLSSQKAGELAQKALALTVRYNSNILNYLSSQGLPRYLALTYPLAFDLRYGENPHQKACVYSYEKIEQIHGKELSYNNILDMDAAWQMTQSFDTPACAVIKHTNPCGLATDTNITKAFQYAFATDKLSAFGGIVALNRPLNAEIAEAFKDHFFEVVIAPGYDHVALNSLKQKESLRIIQAPSPDQKPKGKMADEQIELKDTTFGVLAQNRSRLDISKDDLKVVTQKKPTEKQVEGLLFAWKAVKWVKSNAILLAQSKHTTGIGAGQMSRVDAVELAIRKAKDKAKGSVLASDAFFPFRDSVDKAHKAGITAIIQPGGSRNDQEVIEACNELGIPMAFTGSREFRH